MSNDDIKYLAVERLAQLHSEAGASAALQTIVAIAAQCGVTEIQGRPVLEFYETLLVQIVERRLPIHADHNMEVVSEMKRLWDGMQTRRASPQKPDEE